MRLPFVAAALLLATALGCIDAPPEPPVAEESQPVETIAENLTKVKFSVPEIHCDGCAASVASCLKENQA